MMGERGTLQGGRADRLFRLLVGVYLGGGLLNSMVNLLVPRLRLTLGLNYHQALTVQLAYYSSYLVFALPIALGIVRIGYLRAIAAGLAIVGAGCLLLSIANGARDYPSMLASLLLLSLGATVLQIAGNAVVTAADSGPEMASRFTLLQGFNSLGTVLGPLIGAWFLLGTWRSRLMPELPFLAMGVGLLLLALGFFLGRNLLPRAAGAGAVTPSFARIRRLLADRPIQAGIIAIFAYVGAEVTVGTLAVSYLMLPDTIGAGAVFAGRLVSLYWGGAMIGRFAGSWLLRRIAAARMLMLAACGALLLLAVVIGVGGVAGAITILAIGLCNSVMFPLGYTLAMPDDEADMPLASMLLCMAVVGGAVIPMLTGYVADARGLVLSLLVPGACYIVLVAFALYRSPRNRELP
ncbi:MFS transporter [Sphingomonas sp. PR090111-T3T-6A]|uniref:MFS transporter n=1 Tax=Sphingomonas sp. PR090111-T3T-6A TaxID=685778 RepID=UPI00038064FF|nr:MFS transporter [Sphingomonas sp. PR090111-T3T-6A]